MEGALAENIPVIHTSIGGCRIIGSLAVGMVVSCILMKHLKKFLFSLTEYIFSASNFYINCWFSGNRHGLLVPNSTTDYELQDLRDHLPDSVKVARVEERLSALGNVISCNDYAALLHPDIDTVRNFFSICNHLNLITL